jgi:hypothetical protein
VMTKPTGAATAMRAASRRRAANADRNRRRLGRRRNVSRVVCSAGGGMVSALSVIFCRLQLTLIESAASTAPGRATSDALIMDATVLSGTVRAHWFAEPLRALISTWLLKASPLTNSATSSTAMTSS